jgi:pyruvate kinase
MTRPGQRRAKIVATLGPASSDAATIRALAEAGADVFRLNFSHGSHDDHRARYDIIRGLEAELGRPLGVLADLQGPKLRIGRLEEPLLLEEGARLRLDLDEAPGTAARVPLPHPEVMAALAPGVQLLLDDGKLRLEVEVAGAGSAMARVVVGGRLSERKGVSVVGAVLPVSAMTEKDRADLAFAVPLGVDWIALSFVQRPEDLDEVRALAGQPVHLVAKLEKPAAVNRLDEIVARTDAVMVARGDLGVELAPEKVPTVQRRLLRACRATGKPVIVATQMLESMIEAPIPTRAEASDVATAVYDGADAVMLSAESATGRYPVEAVNMMASIIAKVEADPHYRQATDASLHPPEATVSDVICRALREAAAVLPIKAVVTYTASGKTTLRAARERPAAPILCLTPDLAAARRMSLVWGAYAMQTTEKTEHDAEIVEDAARSAMAIGLAGPDDLIAIAAGFPFGVAGTTNLLRIARVPGARQA